MRSTGRFHPSPALVVAAIALLVSLAGTGVAAVALVPKNSVGSAQVIDGSLQSRDFGAGQVLAGTEAVSKSFGPVNLAGDNLSSVGSLPIAKPGAYVIWAKAQVVNPAVGSAQCKLIARGIPNGGGGTPDAVSASSILDATGAAGNTSPTLWMTLVHGFASRGGSIELVCGGGFHGGGAVRDIKITAVRLGD